VVMDLPVEDGSATFEDYAHVLLASYPVDLQDPVLVGHSLGAMVLPLVAATKPASCWHFCAECFQTSRVGLGRALRRWNGSAHTGQRC
jgi:pimeloyl-ACP methyl ester carboxylesterase